MLIYRDVRTPAPTVFRVPQWLEGCNNLVRQIVRGQAWYWVGEPNIRPEVPASAWHDVPEDFQVANVGPLVPSTLLRHRPELVVTDEIIEDGAGRRWRGLLVFDGDGNCQLTLKWGRDPQTKQLVRMPEEWQVALLTGAKSARAEIEAGRLDQVPVDAAMSWLLPLMCEIYHLHPEVIIQERLCDDRMAVGLLKVSAGHAP
jgi:hypothetical protein